MSHTNLILNHLIKIQISKSKRYKIKKTPKWIYPYSLQVQYQRIIISILQKFIKITNDKAKKILLSWKSDKIIRDSDYPEDDLDDLDDDFDDEYQDNFVKHEDKLKYLLILFAMGVNAFNNKQWQKVLKESLGFDYSVDLNADKILKTWIHENITLISNLTDEYQRRIHNAIFYGYKHNESYSTISKTIGVLNRSFSEARTKKIARDQTQKLNSAFTKQKQTDAGVEIYIWHNMGDERVVGNPDGKYPEGNDVHGDHWIMEGLYCRWDDDTVYSEDGIEWLPRTAEMPKGDPGDEIECRCYAEPVMDTIVKGEEENE